MNIAARRWFREPMVWLLVALPVASVVATVFLLRVGGAGATFDAAPEPVQRSAQVQQRDLAPDRRALELGVTATARAGAGTLPGDAVRVHSDASRVPPHALSVMSDVLPPGDYRLELVHPADARHDRSTTLPHDGTGALVFAAFDPAIAWRLRFGPASGEWRIVGRWDPRRPDAAVTLRPALGDGSAP